MLRYYKSYAKMKIEKKKMRGEWIMKDVPGQGPLLCKVMMPWSSLLHGKLSYMLLKRLCLWRKGETVPGIGSHTFLQQPPKPSHHG